MVAAIVTYLVILIQFMFAEKSSNESKISAEHLITTTTLKSFINQTTMENLPTDSYMDMEWSTTFTKIEEHATFSAIVGNISIY